jgi:hypothetical protein
MPAADDAISSSQVTEVAAFTDHMVWLAFPFKHKLKEGWGLLESDTRQKMAHRHDEITRLETVSTDAAGKATAAIEEPSRKLLGDMLYDRLADPASSQELVWTAEPLRLSDDLHPYLQGMLGAHPPAIRHTTTYYRFCLNQKLLTLFNERPPRGDSEEAPNPCCSAIALNLPHQCGIALALSGEALRRRLGESAGDAHWTAPQDATSPKQKAKSPPRVYLFGLRIHEASVYLSGTRYGHLVLKVQIIPAKVNPNLGGPPEDKPKSPKKTAPRHSALPSGVLLECLHAMGHAARQRDRNARLLRLDPSGGLPVEVLIPAKNGPASLSAFSLREVALALVAPVVDEAPRWERLFTYCAATLHGFPGNDTAIIAELASRLARRQTDDYALGDRKLGIHTVQPFDTVCHAAAIEGGAVVVSPRGAPFLEGYVTNSAAQVYMPLALIANREYGALQRLSQHAAIPIEQGDYSQETVKKLEQLCHHLYNFRLAHRFSSVSGVSLHNEVFSAWRKALNTEQMLKDLNDDVQSATTFLSAVRRNIFEKKFGLLTILIAAGVAFMAITNATESIFKAIDRAFTPSTILPAWDAILAYGPATLAAIGAALLFFIGCYRRRNEIGQ